MKRFKAIAACDVAAFCRKIEKKLIGILKLDPPEQKEVIKALLDFIQDTEFDLDED